LGSSSPEEPSPQGISKRERFAKPFRSLPQAFSKEIAQINRTLVRVLEGIQRWIRPAPHYEALALKRSPVQLSRKLLPYNPLQANELRWFLASLNRPANTEASSTSPSSLPSSVLLLRGSDTTRKHQFLNDLRDLSFSSSAQVQTLDFEAYPSTEALWAGIREKAQALDTTTDSRSGVLVLKNLLAGSLPNSEKERFAEQLKAAFFDKRASEALAQQGISLQGKGLVLEFPRFTLASSVKEEDRSIESSQLPTLSPKLQQVLTQLYRNRYQVIPPSAMAQLCFERQNEHVI
jgi:hypothetical protein